MPDDMSIYIFILVLMPQNRCITFFDTDFTFLYLLKVKYEPKEVSIKIEKCFEKAHTFEDHTTHCQSFLTRIG